MGGSVFDDRPHVESDRALWRAARRSTPAPAVGVASLFLVVRHALSLDHPSGTRGVTADMRPAGMTLPFTLRPHPIPTGRPWWVALIAVGIGVPMLMLRSRTPASIGQVILAVTVAGMLAGVVLGWLYRNRRMLVVDELSVRRVNLFGFARVLSRSDIARVACPLVSSYALPALEPRLLLLDANGRCLLGLRQYYPTDDDAVQLAAALRVPFEMNLASRLTSATRLRRTIPGAVSWPEAHPYLTMLGLILPMLVLASMFVWVLDGFK